MNKEIKKQEPDFSILFKLMSISREQARSIVAESATAKERIDRFRYDALGFIKYYFPHYIRLEPPEWQKALLDILSHPEWDSRKNVYTWRVSEEQAKRLRIWERDEYKYLTKPVDSIRIIALVASREMGKSTIFVRLVMIYLACYRYFRFGVMFRYSDETAYDFLRDTMSEFENNQRLITDFGNLKGSVWKEGQYYLKNGVSIVAMGMGKNARGLVQGPFRPDIIWLDDMTTDKNKKSIEQMSNTYEWIKGAVFGLSKNATMIYVNTIFNSDDPMQRMQEEIASGKQPGGLALRFSVQLNDGKSIWEELWNKEDIENKRLEVGSSIFAIEYMCAVLDSSERILKKEYFIFKPEHELLSISDYMIHFGVDPQSEGPDDAAIAVAGKSLATGHVDILEGWTRDGADVQVFIDKLMELWRKYRPMQITWEANSFAHTYQKLLRVILEAQGIYLPIIPVTAKGSKETRALFMQPHIQNGAITLSEKIEESEFLMKLCRFPTKGLNDGPVDAMYYSIIGFFENLSAPTGSAATRRSNSLPNLIGRYRNG